MRIISTLKQCIQKRTWGELECTHRQVTVIRGYTPKSEIERFLRERREHDDWLEEIANRT